MMALMFMLVACGETDPAGVQTAEAASGGTALADHGLPLSAPDDEAAELYRTISLLADAADGILANQKARQLVKHAPEWSGAWLALANSAQSGEQFARASKHASEFADRGTRAEQLWSEVNMGFVSNDSEAGIRAGLQLTETYPESARAALILSGLYSGQNRVDAARETGARALFLEADWLLPHTNLGFSYLFNEPKDYEKAERYFTQAIALAPDADNLWINVGDVHRAAGKLKLAATSYSQALKLDSGNAIAAIKRAHVNSFLGNYDQARQDYDHGISAGKEGNQATLAVYRAFINLHAGNPDAAVSELRQLIDRIDSLDMPADQKVGTSIFVLTNVADICFHHDMKTCASDAVASLKDSLTAAGENSGNEDFKRQQQATALYWEGKLAARLAQFDQARAKAEAYKVLLETDSNPRKLERYHELLGLTALLGEDFEKSIGHYRQANLTLSAGNGDVKNSYMLSVALQGAGQLDEAARRLAEVSNWNFNSVWFAMLRKTAGQGAD